jgi:hypothetical protein
MRASTRPLFWTALVVTALTLPAAARGQQALDPIQVSVRASEADKLEARADALLQSGSWRDLGKAAGLREKAASLRAPTDPRAFTSLQMAALLRHAMKQRPAAVGLMQQAAEHAMARGDVFNAATAYVNTAFIAVELRDIDLARRSVEKGTLLLHSPLLTETQRLTLQRNLAQVHTPERALAAATVPAAP